MTAFAGIAYLLIAFSPALAIFHKVIASDPLRIILFVLGAFFWLLSLLFSALIWYAAVPLRNTLVFAVCVSIALQELARLLHFILLKKAQKGLSKMAANGMHISGVHTLHHARHMLAVVCGLGMGVMAALFLIINVIADFWGEGTVGLPATVPEVADRFDVKLFAKDEKFPLTYSLSACILTLCHMCWTILFWDGCHKKRYTNTWWISIAFVVASHYVVSALSFWNRSGITMQTIVLCAQLGILLMNAIYSCCVVGITWTMARQMPLAAAKHLYTVITCKEGCHRNVRSTDSNSDARRISSMNEEPHTVNT